MTALVLALPLLPGKAEAWRRASQEMLESRRSEYESSRRRLGITRELAWLAQTPRGEIVLLYLETAGVEQALAGLAQSCHPFDEWFRRQVKSFCGYDLARPLPGWPGEMLFETFINQKGDSHMSLETNKELARRLYQAMNDADLPALDGLLTPDIVNHDPGLPPLPPGPDGFKQVVIMLHSGFPDGKFEIQDIVAEGDLVSVRWIFSGTHQGEFAGVPATGKFISAGGTVIQRLENGRSAEHWAYWDVLGMLTQMGAIPAATPA